MTILSKILVFNKPQEELTCHFCNGSGKIKSDRTVISTQVWSVLVPAMTVIALMSTTKNATILNVGLFVIGAILSVLTLREYKQQRKY